MWSRPILSGLAALALSAGVSANVPVETLQPVYIEGGQYSAVLTQRTQQWRLLSGDGIDLQVRVESSGCVAGGHVPEGIWLVSRDAAGRPLLVAPSHTALPEAHPGEVALRACGESADGHPYVAAPQGLIDWLTYHSGAIYVED